MRILSKIYLSDFEPYGPADLVENIRIEVNQRNKSRKDEAPLIHDPLFSSVILKFIKEGLEGLRVKYITQRKGFMEKYNPKHKRQIKTMLLNMVLLEQSHLNLGTGFILVQRKLKNDDLCINKELI